MGAVRNQLKKEGLSKKTIDVIADALEAQGEFTSLGWVDVASATITNIAAANSPNVRITGTNTITGLGTAASGTKITARFAGALTFTHNGTSLILPGTANITTAANDTADMVSLGSGNWICTSYKKASGAAVVVAGGGGTKVWKTATETVTASTVLQDDNELFFTVLSNKTYRIKLNFVYEDSGLNDIKATLIVPSFAAPVSATNVDVMLLNIMSVLTLRTANSDSTIVSGATNGSISGEYYLHVGSVGGQVIFRWAQSVASGTGKVYAGSFIEYEQLD